MSRKREERDILGVYAEMPDFFAITFRGEDQRGEDHSFLCWKRECGMASAVCFHVCPNRMLDYWTPSQAEKNPDNAPGRLIRIIKGQRRGPIGGAMIRDMMIQKKSFLVLDWPLRAVNAKGSTKTFQMMVNEQGWTNIEERSYYGSSEQVSSSADTMNIISR